MIAMEKKYRKESREQTLQLAQIFPTELKARRPPNVQEN
jgi:hypothetical protein